MVVSAGASEQLRDVEPPDGGELPAQQPAEHRVLVGGGDEVPSRPDDLSVLVQPEGVGLVAVAVSFAMGRQGYGLFVPVFREQFGMSLSAAGFLASAAYVGYLFSVVSTGVLAACRGSRLPVLIGCAVAAAGTALVAAAPTTAVLGVGVVLAGAVRGGPGRRSPMPCRSWCPGAGRTGRWRG